LNHRPVQVPHAVPELIAINVTSRQNNEIVLTSAVTSDRLAQEAEGGGRELREWSGILAGPGWRQAEITVDIDVEATWTRFCLFCAQISFALSSAPASRFLVLLQDR
jgi:hypothetical protein